MCCVCVRARARVLLCEEISFFFIRVVEEEKSAGIFEI
jgi:hypothetical protein